LKQLLSRLSYANVMATLALFVALGGTAAAGAQAWVTGAAIRDGSITGADVQNRSLSGMKLARESVTGNIVRNRSITGFDIRDGSLRAPDFDVNDLQQLRGPKGDTGAQGVQGPKGDKGDKGDPGSSDIVRLFSTAPDMPNYQNATTVISRSVPAEGGWLMLARLDVTNTSANDDNFGCMLLVGGRQLGGGGDSVLAGTTKEIIGVAFGPVTPSQQVDVVCDGGASATFDVRNVRLSLAKLM
jgi:hypothetical protein